MAESVVDEPHADLIARLHGDVFDAVPDDGDLQHVLSLTVAALSNSVPRESYRQLHDQHEATRGWREKAERERDAAEAKLAAVAAWRQAEYHEMHESEVGVHCFGCEQTSQLDDILKGRS